MQGDRPYLVAVTRIRNRTNTATSVVLPKRKRVDTRTRASETYAGVLIRVGGTHGGPACVCTHTVHTRSAYYRPALMQQVDRVSIDVLLIGG